MKSHDRPIHVLLVDDDDGLREVTTFQLEAAGFRVTACAGGAAGLAAFEEEPTDVVVTDLKMPDIDGMQLLVAVRKIDPQVPVLVVTAFGSVDTAVEAMRSGAFDYLTKPFSRDALRLKIQRAAEHREILRENRALRSQVEASASRPLLVASAAMRSTMEQARRLAGSDLPVLLAGESGTGKELVARELHRLSPRAAGPFVAVNCAAIPSELLEAELFGHARGAFTGANRAREGRFRGAHGGTLLLDEIGDLPLDLQPKLLRVLQERAVEPVGGERPVPIDVRVVAATHRDLGVQVREGRFRQDLYYRLAVLPIRVPPLRERSEAIGPLFDLFLQAQARQSGRRLELGADATEALKAQRWPGNVRELENVARRVALVAAGPVVHAADIPAPAALSGGPGDPDEDPRRRLVVDLTTEPWSLTLPSEGLALPDLEARLVEEAIRRFAGNKSAAARYLGVPRHVLLYRLEKYDIDPGSDG